MTSAKVTVTKEVAEAIQTYLSDFPGKRTDEEMRGILVAEHCGQDWRNYETGQYIALNNITTFELMNALVNGYTVEKSPEDKVREYYDRCHANLKEAEINGRTHRASNFDGQATGVSITLDILGIKISGVNA